MQTTKTTKARVAAWHIVLAWSKAAVSLGLLWLLFATYDVREAVVRLSSIETWSLAFAAVAVPISIFLVVLRWRLVLASMGERLPLGPTLALVMIGLFFNQVLPSNVGGEAMRIWRLCRRGVAVGRAVSSVMLDRAVGIVGLAILVLATLPAAARLIEDVTLLAAFGLFILAVAAALAALLWLDRVTLIVRRALPARLVAGLFALAADSRTVLLDRRRGLAILGLSVSNQLLIVLLMVALARGLDIRAEAISLLVLVPPALLATMLPLSFAGWGVREGVMVALLGIVGVAPDQALALSITFGLVVLVGSLPGGIVWLATGNREH